MFTDIQVELGLLTLDSYDEDDSHDDYLHHDSDPNHPNNSNNPNNPKLHGTDSYNNNNIKDNTGIGHKQRDIEREQRAYRPRNDTGLDQGHQTQVRDRKPTVSHGDGARRDRRNNTMENKRLRSSYDRNPSTHVNCHVNNPNNPYNPSVYDPYDPYHSDDSSHDSDPTLHLKGRRGGVGEYPPDHVDEDNDKNIYDAKNWRETEFQKLKREQLRTFKAKPLGNRFTREGKQSLRLKKIRGNRRKGGKFSKLFKSQNNLYRSRDHSERSSCTSSNRADNPDNPTNPDSPNNPLVYIALSY